MTNLAKLLFTPIVLGGATFLFVLVLSFSQAPPTVTEITVEPMDATMTYKEDVVVEVVNIDAIIISNYIQKVEHKDSDFSDTLADKIVYYSALHGYDPLLITSIIKHESDFDSHCRGAAGERGLMQVHPCHFREFDRNKLWDIDYNLEAGMKVLSDHINSAGSLYGGLRGYTGGRAHRYDRTWYSLKGERANETD